MAVASKGLMTAANEPKNKIKLPKTRQQRSKTMHKKYIRDFSDPNPRYLLFAFLILAAIFLSTLGHLQESERIHCLKTSTIKEICK